MGRPPNPKKRKAVVLEAPDEFIIECPVRPKSKNQNTDVVVERDDPGVPDLAINFSVRPGSKWASMKGFRNVKCGSRNLWRALRRC